MLKKVRLYNMIILICTFTITVIPLVAKYTSKLIPLLSIICFGFITMYTLERYITFGIVKSLDNLKWINNTGVGPIFILLRILAVLAGATFLGLFLESMENTNILPFLYMMIQPFIVENARIHVGEQLIYTQGRYIPMKDVTKCEYMQFREGKHIHYTQFKIYIGEKCYIFKIQETLKEEGLIIIERLSKFPTQIIQIQKWN